MIVGRVLAAGILAAGAPAVAAPEIPAVPAATFVGQSTTLGADGSFSMVLRLPGGVAADGSDGSLLRITSHEPVTSRQMVRLSIADTPTARLDQLEIPIAGIPRNADGTLAVTVNTEPTDVESVRLQIRGSGLFPLTTEVVLGDVVSEPLTTFIEQPGDAALTPLRVGMVVGVDSPPTLQADGTTTITPAVRKRLAALATLLERTPVDLTVSLRPELVEGLGRSGEPADAELLARLAGVLAVRHQVLSVPYIGISPSVAVAGSRTGLFTAQLRHGEDVLSAQLGGIDTERSTWFLTEPIDAPGLDLLRELGVFRLVVDSSLLPLGPTAEVQGIDGRLRAVEASSGDPIPAVISDPFLQHVLEASTDSPPLLAHQLLADLSALQLEASQPDPSGPGTRAVMFTVDDPSVIDLDLVEAVMGSIGASPRLQAMGGIDVAGRLARASRTGDAVRIELPEPDISRATDLSFTIGRVENGLTSTASILPADDPRPTRWRTLLDLLADQRLTTAMRDGYVAQLDGEMGDIRASVELTTDAGTINLGGRRSKIPLVVTNSSSTVLHVLVRFSSSKLDFPEGDDLVTLPAGETLLEVPVVVKSSGRFQVNVQILTADGTQELVGRTTITAQATVLTGLAQVVTAAFVLVLATWWVQHVRQERRRRAAAAAASLGNHPSSAAADTGGPGGAAAVQ